MFIRLQCLACRKRGMKSCFVIGAIGSIDTLELSLGEQIDGVE
jgi:hypothetical protein